jgi:hypothetical protein
MIDFLDAIVGGPAARIGYCEIRAMRAGQVKQGFFPLDDLSEAQRYAILQDSIGWDVYFGVVPRVTRSGSAADCMPAISTLWVDIDAKAFTAYKSGAFMALARVSPAPQIVVDSGHGYHAYWLLNDRYEFGEAQAAMKGLEKATGADNCSDKPRVLRLPGTHNHKKGGNAPVRLIRFDVTGRRHRLSDFADYVDLGAPPPRRAPMVDHLSDDWEPSDADAPKFPEGTRNNGLARLGGIMVARGMSLDDILVALSHENQVRCDPPLPDTEVAAIARSVWRYR